jgi:opacity protein-like surface antigen
MALIAAVTAALPFAARAQDQPSVRRGNFEIGLFAGESYGLDRFRPMGGANVAYGLSRALFPFVEGSYLPGVLRRSDVATGTTTSARQFSINMTDFHGGLHIRVPKPESRVVPYAVIGVGLIHGGQSTATYYNVSQFGGVDVQNQTVPSSTSFAFNFGGGLRFFFNERFAVRAEFKGFKPTSAPPPLDPRVFYRFAIGPVFQFR